MIYSTRYFFSIISNINISADNSNSTFILFKRGFHVNPGANKKCPSSILYISRYLLRNLSNTSAIMMCHVAHTNHDTHQIIYVNAFPYSFSMLVVSTNYICYIKIAIKFVFWGYLCFVKSFPVPYVFKWINTFS